MKSNKTYKSSIVKSISATILMSILVMSGSNVLEVNAKESTKVGHNIQLKEAYKIAETFKVEDNKVYAYTIANDTDRIKVDTTNFAEDSRLEGLNRDKLFYLAETGEPTVTNEGKNHIDDNYETLYMYSEKANKYIESITGMSFKVSSSIEEEIQDSPKAFIFINFDKTERVKNGKIQDGTIQANNKPYTIDVLKAFGKEVAENPKATFKISYNSKVTKEVNKEAVNIYMPQFNTLFNGKDIIKNLNSDKAISAKLLKASNNSFLTFEALSEGTSEVTVVPEIDGKEVGEAQTFKLTLDKALKEKPTKPNDVDDNSDGDGGNGDNGTDNGDGDGDVTIKPTPKPPVDNDSDTTIDTDTDKPTDKPTNKPTDKPTVDNNLPNLSDDTVNNNTNNTPKPNTNSSSDSLKNPNLTNNVKDKETEMKSLPKTGQEENNVPAIVGMVIVILGIFGLGFSYVRNKKRVNE